MQHIMPPLKKKSVWLTVTPLTFVTVGSGGTVITVMTKRASLKTGEMMTYPEEGTQRGCSLVFLTQATAPPFCHIVERNWLHRPLGSLMPKYMEQLLHANPVAGVSDETNEPHLGPRG